MLFLYTHIYEEESLRAISDAVPDEDLGQALGLDEISASLVFVHIVQQIHGHKKGQKKETVYEGISFASPLKKNVVIWTLETFSLAEESSVISDSMVVIGITQKRTENALRLIETVNAMGPSNSHRHEPL